VSQLVCRPSGTRLCSTSLPGTYVPGFPVSPLRGWSNRVFHFLAVLRVATQTWDARLSIDKNLNTAHGILSSLSHPSIVRRYE
jgi:hypothetical protein